MRASEAGAAPPSARRDCDIPFTPPMWLVVDASTRRRSVQPTVSRIEKPARGWHDGCVLARGSVRVHRREVFDR